MHHDFDGMTDEEIALLAQQGDADASEYLLNKYKNFVRSKARSYFLVGADHEDIVQEGMIGLFKAFRDFRPDKLASFHAFAEICVTRQIITAIKTATRQKHIPLNSYVSLNKPIYEEESDRTLMDVITEGRSADPEELLIGRESYVSIESRIDEALSPLERRVLAAYLDGKSYQEIAQMLDRHVKSIDNALQRVKHKLEKLMATIRSREISACLVLQTQSQLKAQYKDSADTICGNCDSVIFLGGKEKTTLKELSEALGRETIDTLNTGESRGRETSRSTNFQKLGKELMSVDELAVMDGRKCILQLRGVRPFLSDKYDITQHPNYKYLSDADSKNTFDIERFLKRRLKLKSDEQYDVFEVNVSDADE